MKRNVFFLHYSIVAILMIIPFSTVYASSVDSCNSEIQRYCKDEYDNKGNVSYCLIKNKNNISVSCAELLQEIGKATREMHEECAEEIKKFCIKSTELQPKPFPYCLFENRVKSSYKCKVKMGNYKEYLDE